jgi:hypothetical protein
MTTPENVLPLRYRAFSQPCQPRLTRVYFCQCFTYTGGRHVKQTYLTRTCRPRIRNRRLQADHRPFFTGNPAAPDGRMGTHRLHAGITQYNRCPASKFSTIRESYAKSQAHIPELPRAFSQGVWVNVGQHYTMVVDPISF